MIPPLSPLPLPSPSPPPSPLILALAPTVLGRARFRSGGGEDSDEARVLRREVKKVRGVGRGSVISAVGCWSLFYFLSEKRSEAISLLGFECIVSGSGFDFEMR